MIQPLKFHDVMKIAAMCGVTDYCVAIIDVRSGRMYENCTLDLDPDTEHAFAYTLEGAYWDYDYGSTWWAYSIIPTKAEIPSWDIA